MAELSGTTFCITGANTGIGRAAAVALARRGARVVLAGRSQQRMQDTLRDIAHTAGSAAFVPLDLGDLESVRAAAATTLALDEPIHVLINNAGLAGQRGMTTSGFELAFGVNHVGHFLWTELLRDHVARSAEERGRPGRVVVVSSDSHHGADGIDFAAVREPTRSVTGMSEYAVSKLANVLHAQELARRVDPSTITTYALHPGVIASDIWRRVPWPVRPVMRLFMKSTDEGARTTVYCATSDDVADETGRYYVDCAPAEANRHATPALAAELWERSARWTAA